MTNPGSARDGVPTGLLIGLLAALLLAVPLAAPGVARAQQGSVRAELGATTISIDESVRLVVVATGIDGELDTSVLQRSFETSVVSSSREVQELNGVRRSIVTWVLELVPRAVGVFTVPPVTVDGIESELLSLTVTEAPTGGERNIFVEAEVDDDTPWVQSQVILKLRVLRAIDIVDGALGEPAGDGLDVRALGEDRRYTERRDGREYVVIERRFALFAQRSGPLVVEPITLSVTVPADPSRVRGFFSPTRKLTRRTRALTLEVRPRPADSSGWWLPASGVAIGDDWNEVEGAPASGESALEARVGEPLTRTIRLVAKGVLDTQLPRLDTSRVDGLAIYADDPARESVIGADGLEAVQTLSLALIPAREGVFELPPIDVDWFDVGSGTTRTATLPGRALTVLPALGPDATSGSPLAPVNENGPGGTSVEPSANAEATVSVGRWRLIAIAALLGWTLTAFVLVLSRRARRLPSGSSRASVPTGREASVREARERLERSARAGDTAALARAVLARAAVDWPDDPPRSLAALTRRLDAVMPTEGMDGSGELGERLAALDAALYRRAGTPRDGAASFVSLPALLERALARRRDEAPPPVGSVELPPL